ncbi:MAG: HDOD domain-containing protein [gamma proteobacterium endosymbiont of Lamellibrachia anaximandri]|nr:HDOD domain-containing protein [gamma proteobacterium endosymbiont of Lamellibrachia anaximandri]
MSHNVVTATASEILRFNPIRKLPARVLAYVATFGTIEHFSKGTQVVTEGTKDPFVNYLMHGEVDIDCSDGTHLSLQAESNRSTYPLSVKQPHACNITAKSAVVLLKMPREIIQSIACLPTDESGRDSQSIELKETGGPEARLYWEFHQAMKDGHIELPSMPDVATRIAKVVNNPSTDSDDIARVIQADPTIAARVISVVNSAAYRGQDKIGDLPDAVTRLGRNVTHNLVISFALGSLFKSRSKHLQRRMIASWKHACQVAPICHELARVTPGLSPDRALLCGLVHDIGALPIISAGRSHPEMSENPKLLEQVINNLQAEVGAMVLRKWEFADEFVQAALHAEDWMADDGDRPNYADLVRVAQLHVYIGTPMMRSLPRMDLTPSFHKLAQGKLTPSCSLGIIERAKSDIREMQQLLIGG